MSSPFLSSAAARTISTSSGRAFLPEWNGCVVFEGGQRLGRGRQFAFPVIVERFAEVGGHGCGQVVERQGEHVGAPRVVATGLEPIGKIENLIERGHRCSGQGVLADGGENGLVLDPEPVAGELGAERRMEHDRVVALELTDREPTLLGFPQEPLAGVEAGEIVQEAGDPGGLRGEVMGARQRFRGPRDAQNVRVAMLLSDVLAHPPRR